MRGYATQDQNESSQRSAESTGYLEVERLSGDISENAPGAVHGEVPRGFHKWRICLQLG